MTYYGQFNHDISDIQVFYLVNPPSGSQTVAWTQGSTKAYYVNPFALVYSGVSQLSPIDASASNSAPNTANSVTVTGTTPNPNDWCILFGLSEARAVFAGTNVTNRQGMDGTSQYGVGDSSSSIISAGSYSQSFTVSDTGGDLTGYAVYLKPSN